MLKIIDKRWEKSITVKRMKDLGQIDLAALFADNGLLKDLRAADHINRLDGFRRRPFCQQRQSLFKSISAQDTLRKFQIIIARNDNIDAVGKRTESRR